MVGTGFVPTGVRVTLLALLAALNDPEILSRVPLMVYHLMRTQPVVSCLFVDAAFAAILQHSGLTGLANSLEEKHSARACVVSPLLWPSLCCLQTRLCSRYYLLMHVTSPIHGAPTTIIP